MYGRYIEIVGFSLSMICICLSILIFIRFRILKNIRIKIHRHVLYAVLGKTIISLIIFFDQNISRQDDAKKVETGIENIPGFCEVLYFLQEYADSAVFSWVFVEGLHLNYLISNNVLQSFKFGLYRFYAWLVPFVLTSVWALVVWINYRLEKVKLSNEYASSWTDSLHYNKIYNWPHLPPIMSLHGRRAMRIPAVRLKEVTETPKQEILKEIPKCWYGYNFDKTYWILQGPRLVVVLCNAIILIRVLRMVLKKLNECNTPEILKIKKSVKAALFLLPILGLSNVLSTFDVPINSSTNIFMIIVYIRQFLKSWQGLILSLIYCIGIEEVRSVITRRLHITWFYNCNCLTCSCLSPPLQRNDTLHMTLPDIILPMLEETSVTQELRSRSFNQPVQAQERGGNILLCENPCNSRGVNVKTKRTKPKIETIMSEEVITQVVDIEGEEIDL